MNRVGQRLGNYRLIRPLGRGGSAEVYLAQHIFLKTLAAIKILGARLNKNDLADFLNEARIIAALDHPHIVHVLEFGVEGSEALEDLTEDSENVAKGTPYLVMDYAPNDTLRVRHPKGVRVPLAHIVSYVKQVADALQYAHDKRVIHRDIKPENMLVGRNNEILLSDFGIALVNQNSFLQITQEIVGTIGYTAPEQLQGKPRLASDQYSLGVVVYEWLCGVRPFQGSFIEQYNQHLQLPPPPLYEKLPGIPSEIAQVVMTALAKDPQQRFTNVKAFANALEHACRPHLSPFPMPTSRPTATPGVHTSFTESPNSPLPVTSPNMLTPPQQHTTAITPAEPLFLESPFIPPSSPGSTYTASPTLTRPSREPTGPMQPAPLIPRITTPSQSGIQPSSRHRISRRTFLTSLGLGMAGLAAAGGITAWLVLSQNARIPMGENLLSYNGHFLAVYGLAWSPDGTRIASVGADKTVQVWDAMTGKTIFIYRNHTRSTNGVAWQPHEGTRIASASADATVQIWDATTGDNILTYRGHSDNVRSVTWSPDGKHIASAGDDMSVQVWDAITGNTLFTYHGHTNLVWYIMWSPDGTRVASASEDTTAQVWDASTGNHIFTYGHHTKGVQSLTWSPDSNRIASASSDTTVQVWDADTGNHAFVYHGHTDTVQGVAWSPHSSRIASSSVDVQLWDASSGGNLFIYRGQPPSIHGVEWSLDGTRIASAGDDATVRVWQAV